MNAMIKLLQSRWIVAVIGAIFYAVCTVVFWPHIDPPPAADAHAAAPPKAVPSWEFENPEVDQLIADLKKEREMLGQREQDLNQLAARLQAERAELNQVTQTVHQLQTDLDQTVLRVRDEETANLKKLAKMYAAMEPSSAALVFTELDDAAVVKIMVFMREDEAAPILEILAKRGAAETKRAAAISERLRLTVYRKTAAPS